MDHPEARLIPDAGFAGDEGGADPLLAAALASYAVDRSRRADVLAALGAARLLVPVVAVLGEVDVDARGATREKSSDMAAVLMRGSDGRLALLAFTCVGSMRAWDQEARPVPVTAQTAARAAVQDEAAALLLDLAGPVRCVVEGDDLAALAAGYRLARTPAGPAWVGPSG